MMRILIADDDKVSLRLLHATLSGLGYEVVSCTTGSDAWRVLQESDAPQLAILDWEMPGMDGPEVCRVVRSRQSERYTYILLLTSRNEKQDIVAGLNAGADDYLTKPFDTHELDVRLRTGRRILELQQRLREQATRDPLTDILNRGAIVDTLSQELRRAKRERRPIGIAMADLDYFKRINDTYGHAAGDEVLREATRRMRASMRLYDTLGRYGGEEFLIVAPGCDLECMSLLAERVRAVIAEAPISIDGSAVSVTCSLGVAANEGAHHRAIDALIQAADEALYRAKRGGRNAVVQAALPDDQEASVSNG